ncbi:sulfate-transporting ATPase [Amylolactobacillus amylotrophicus DSM 20534]|uniref:Multidrug ABC transporter ATP-binding protein n=3 Tax=Amylolactobacillus TaxID=2767876 RepID=A0A1L6XAJ3_9LACO|nr:MULTISPECIES: ABC transporter ATP-binding protein [Amylolactobacillus]APT18004.1 multidrug ABC transporter ATP-binding protein [Amylolactobacillus amylophilus DSM 20533 = JCM 1125]KRK37288.1 sulfate-transporting ATPase [Amylolactobacillus amylotrophicus DSM 20534]KRM41687.1 sulfate-transporting ATPase [Amylolactobacillus amylophilus DSM 20533 = JCM 1125]GED80715.1 ABC transporter ATP-binding protein [Amylolactobacillus amylophilus]
MGLIIKNLVGGYQNVPVIKGINLEIQPGEAVGLIGLNGAGKSTTIKHVLGLLRPISGEISLNELTLKEQPTQFKQQVAVIPETPVLYPELTLKEHLELTILAYGLDRGHVWPHALELLKLFRLDDKLGWLPIHFSKGMKQKVMIVNAFLTDAQLLIIDEPFTGLDPLAVANLIDLINSAKRAGKMVLLTTHVLQTARRALERYVVLNNGLIVLDGSLDSIKQHYEIADDNFGELYQKLAVEQSK